MTHTKLFLAFTLAAALHAVPLRGQPTDRSDSGDAPSTAAAQDDTDPAAATSEHLRQYREWKEIIKGIELLRLEFQTAGADRRAELQKELQTRFEAAQSMVPALVESGLTALEATDGTDEELTRFLVAIAWYRLTSDRYEEALPVIEGLVASDADQPGVALWGAVAAFSVADYEAARRYYQEADAAGDFAAPPQEENERAIEVWHLAVELRKIIDEHEAAWQEEQSLRAEEATADDLPRVSLRTTKGDILVELFENEAPNTVKNFITLVEQGVYDGTAFHRVLPNFMAQGGNPITADKAPLDYTIPCECYGEDARKHFRGSLSMAHAGRDTGSAQFFLTFRPTPHLDGQTFYPGSPNDAHTVFGRVIEGMDVLAELNRINPEEPPPPQAAQPEPDRITAARVLRKRPGTDYGDFKKLAR